MRNLFSNSFIKLILDSSSIDFVACYDHSHIQFPIGKYFENSDGTWSRQEYDSNGNETYYEDSNGIKLGTPRAASCAGKVVEIDGKK